MLRRIVLTTGLATALGAAACGSDAEVKVTDAPAAGDSEPSVPEPPPTEDAPSGEPGTAAPQDSDDGAASESGSSGPVPARDIDYPEWWAQETADVCLEDRELCDGACPTFGDALEDARASASATWAVRDYCLSDDGEPFITLAPAYPPGVIHVFQAGSGEKISTIVSDDVVNHCLDTAPTHLVVWGRFIADCMWVRRAELPCTDAAAPNLGSFDNCWYALTP
jgi:hypothetical protein